MGRRSSTRQPGIASWTAARRSSSGAHNARNAIKHVLNFISMGCFVWSSNLRSARACFLGIKDGASSCFALDEEVGDGQGDCASSFFLKQQCVSTPEPIFISHTLFLPMLVYKSIYWKNKYIYIYLPREV